VGTPLRGCPSSIITIGFQVFFFHYQYETQEAGNYDDQYHQNYEEENNGPPGLERDVILTKENEEMYLVLLLVCLMQAINVLYRISIAR
jgi:hypothetical protein